MEFKKLRKGFLKKGIKVVSFTLTLSVLMLSIFAFKNDDVVDAYYSYEYAAEDSKLKVNDG